MGYRPERRIVIVTRATQLSALRQKFATPSQARFHVVSARKRELARAGAPAAAIDKLAAVAFTEVEAAADTYEATVLRVRQDLEAGGFDLPVQIIDRAFVPNFVFGPNDVVLTIGQDGLVANTAKYVLGRPIVAVNPDPARIDGVLLPFKAEDARWAVRDVLSGTAKFREVTLAQATMADGQVLLAFNELFIGCRSHVSARYRLKVGTATESQSSSGILVSTGAGSTGWMSSVFRMAAGVMSAFAGGSAKTGKAAPSPRLSWEDPKLVYVVREPFVSKTSAAELIAGVVEAGREIVVESEMASDGVIFSDGVEADYIEFNSGAIARIGAAPTKARIVAARTK